MSLSICLFVDDGVTGNKNTNYLYVNGCLNEITDAGTRVVEPLEPVILYVYVTIISVLITSMVIIMI